MEFRKFAKQVIISVAVSIFLLIISGGFAQAKDNQPSPLFRESLRETLKEFNSGTSKIRGNAEQVKSQDNRGMGLLRNVKNDPRSYQTPGVFSRPTFWVSTCRGFRCYGFPTLVGVTCSQTCGVRSTCSNGWFCRRPGTPSPSAELNNPDRLAKGTEKPFTFTIF
jgi:hypothetical protein